jgi:hypothetical protein
MMFFKCKSCGWEKIGAYTKCAQCGWERECHTGGKVENEEAFNITACELILPAQKPKAVLSVKPETPFAPTNVSGSISFYLGPCGVPPSFWRESADDEFDRLMREDP